MDLTDIDMYRLVEVRAAQRTFEGAYVRTALGQFSFALIILKVFTQEFYAIGALFAVYGVAVMLVAIYRRYEGQNQFFTSESPDGSLKRKFRTSGNSVLLLTMLSLSALSGDTTSHATQHLDISKISSNPFRKVTPRTFEAYNVLPFCVLLAAYFSPLYVGPRLSEGR
ncbi:hypothetical protein FPANT_4345 [Fusarium pseudoanthophilum]|uniref:DUF202 domain-containing protein n=1 Tax=Fusarium pseudoanthophilum TaxID=48495 RepID=A0A8H5USZ6_9HYPO|nr:hypothetical protein FPANT_4345 [Fusarium pseudoanthophilum]